MPLSRFCQRILCCCKTSEKKTTRSRKKEVVEGRVKDFGVEGVFDEDNSTISNILSTQKDRTLVEIITYTASPTTGRRRTKDEGAGVLTFHFQEVRGTSPCDHETSLPETTDTQYRKPSDYLHNFSACERIPESLDASDEQDNHLPPGRDILARDNINDGQGNVDSKSNASASNKSILSESDAHVHQRVDPVNVPENVTEVPVGPHLTLHNDEGEVDDSGQPKGWEIEQETESLERSYVKGHSPLKETTNGEDRHLETQTNFMPTLQDKNNEQNNPEKPIATSQAMLGETSADPDSFKLNPSMHVSESVQRRDQGTFHSLAENSDGHNSSVYGEATQVPTCQYEGCTRCLPDEGGFYSSCFCEAHREKGTKVICQSHEHFKASATDVTSQEPTDQSTNVHQITITKGSLEKDTTDQRRESPTDNQTHSRDNPEGACLGSPIQAQKEPGDLTQLLQSDQNQPNTVGRWLTEESHDKPTTVHVQVSKEIIGALPPGSPTAIQQSEDKSHPGAHPLQGNQENKYPEVPSSLNDANTKYEVTKEKEKPVIASTSATIPANSGIKSTSSVQKQSGHRNRKSSSRQSDAKLRQMRKPICFYHKEDPYYEFTNFYLVYVQIDGMYWSTTENYFQAQKYIGTPLYGAIQECRTAREAFTLSRSPQGSRWRRSDWEEVKQDVMYVALYAKFTQHQQLKKLLLKTGDRPLIEHTERDSYWGDGGDGSGQNHLGKLLMRLRKELTQV